MGVTGAKEIQQATGLNGIGTHLCNRVDCLFLGLFQLVQLSPNDIEIGFIHEKSPYFTALAAQSKTPCQIRSLASGR